MKFIDLFAGIGGFRMALENLGGQCVLSAEWNKYARETYAFNFKIDHPYETDVAKLANTPEKIPAFDFMTAGFPCQPFSTIGLRNGMEHEAGNCFFDLCKIINHCRPSYFLLENVPGLLSNDNRKTFKMIMKTLEIDLGYSVYWKVLNSYPWVPQLRRRCYIFGLKEPEFAYEFPNPPHDKKPILRDILEKNIYPEYAFSDDKIRRYERQLRVHPAWCLPYLGEEDVAYTFVANYRPTQSKPMLFMQDNGRPRVFSPREVARCMGFPDSYKFPENMPESQIYHQLGNSVVIPVIQAIVEQFFD